MLVNYTINENNVVIGYTVIPFDPNLPHIEINSVDEIVVGISKIIDGVLSTNIQEKEAAEKALLEKIELMNELNNLTSWFEKYDQKAIQWARDIRLSGNSPIDISAFDAQAEINKVRINEIKEILNLK